MAPRKKKVVVEKVVADSLADSVVGLDTQVGETLLIRANPSDDAVRGWVEEHMRRYIAGEPGGPSGIPAYRIFTAKRYASEEAHLAGDAPVAEIDITDLLPTA